MLNKAVQQSLVAEGPQRPHFVWAIRHFNVSWGTGKSLKGSDTQTGASLDRWGPDDARTSLADYFSILLMSWL